ncbi:MAG: hypothetical protein KDD27_10475 [Saprospiraceae bacterium]|nr:hypothetical protein [Saprospiraceae bacterium]
MKSLLIEHEGRKRMYNQGFLNEAIMLLRKDGTDELFPLGNVQLLPDLNIEKYLEEYLVPKLESQPGEEKESPEDCIYDLLDGRKIQITKRWEKGNCFDQGNSISVKSEINQGNAFEEVDTLKLRQPFEIRIVPGFARFTSSPGLCPEKA